MNDVFIALELVVAIGTLLTFLVLGALWIVDALVCWKRARSDSRSARVERSES